MAQCKKPAGIFGFGEGCDLGFFEGFDEQVKGDAASGAIALKEFAGEGDAFERLNFFFGEAEGSQLIFQALFGAGIR